MFYLIHQLWMPFLFIAGVVGFFVIMYKFGMKAVDKQNAKMLGLFEQMASQYGLKAYKRENKLDYPFIKGLYKNREFLIDHKSVRIRRNASTAYVFIRSAIRNPQNLVLIIAQGRIFHHIDRNHGMTKVNLYDAKLNDCLTIKANNEKLAKSLLEKSSVKKMLDQFVLNNWHGNLKMEPGQITYYECGLVKKEKQVDKLKEKFEFMGALVEALEKS